ncbi:MAG: DUF2971 domain-containing protein [Deltaproteobacteria bacterium]
MKTWEEEIREILKPADLCGIRKLYRYRSLESPENGSKESRELERIFTSREIWMPKPSDFNDPFECQPKLILGLGRLGISSYLRKLENRRLSYTDETTRKRLLKEAKEKLYSDPHGVAKNSYEQFLHNTGLYCLSEKNDDILMWSHYASGHRGLCLEFDPAIDAQFANRYLFGSSLQVIYSEERPVFNVAHIGKPREYQKALLTKSIHWRYEKEWRIIKTSLEGGPGPKPFHSRSMTGIIFGAIISPENKQKIINWIRRYPTKLSLYQAKINKVKFKLDIEPI